MGQMLGLEAGAWKDKTGTANSLAFADALDQHHVKNTNANEDIFMIKEWDNDNETTAMKFK